MASCSLPHEVFDKNPGNGCQGDAADEHVANIVSRGARSHRCFVVFGSDWTFVRVHRTLLIHENRRKNPNTANGLRSPPTRESPLQWPAQSCASYARNTGPAETFRGRRPIARSSLAGSGFRLGPAGHGGGVAHE